MSRIFPWDIESNLFTIVSALKNNAQKLWKKSSSMKDVLETDFLSFLKYFYFIENIISKYSKYTWTEYTLKVLVAPSLIKKNHL